MKWITEIKDVEPYTVTCLWNDGVIRAVEFEDFLSKKSEDPKNYYAQLLSKEKFLQVKCDGTTLYWDNGLMFKDYDGASKDGPLDIAPEVLFELTAEGKTLKVNDEKQ